MQKISNMEAWRHGERENEKGERKRDKTGTFSLIG
jgi:hypothetical protein